MKSTLKKNKKFHYCYAFTDQTEEPLATNKREQKGKNSAFAGG